MVTFRNRITLDSDNPPPSRRNRRRIETQERLFEAALNLLCERDFDAVTIEMITEAADVGKGTFFNYFKNKEAVIVAYFDRAQSRLIESLRLPAETPPEPPAGEDAPGPIWKQFLMTAHRLAEIDGRSHRLTRTLFSLALTNDAARQANQRLGVEVGASANALMKLGQETGEFRADVDAAFLSEFMGRIYRSVLHDWALKDSEEPLEAALMRNFALAWDAIRNRRTET